MDFFGIGILELFFIILIALIVLGPRDMVKAGRMMGQALRKILLAPGFMEAQRWVRNLPAQLMREAGIEEIQNDLRKEADKIRAETTINLDGDQPSISGTVSRSPDLTPYQSAKMPSGGLNSTGLPPETTEMTEITYPPQPQPPASPPTDIPGEWTGVASSQTSRIRAENLEDFPVEWLRPPEPRAAQNPPSPSDTENQDSEITDEQAPGQE
jgi:Sec-independent protein translocase protein TatA